MPHLGRYSENKACADADLREHTAQADLSEMNAGIDRRTWPTFEDDATKTINTDNTKYNSYKSGHTRRKHSQSHTGGYVRNSCLCWNWKGHIDTGSDTGDKTKPPCTYLKREAPPSAITLSTLAAWQRRIFKRIMFKGWGGEKRSKRKDKDISPS